MTRVPAAAVKNIKNVAAPNLFNPSLTADSPSVLFSFFLASVSSLLTLLIFQRFNDGGLAWICLIPLAFALIQNSPRRAFWIAWMSGTFAYVGIFYWLLITYQAAHQSVLLAIGSLLALALYLGVFWGAWGWFIARLEDSPWYALGGAAAWTALEFLRTYLFSGFPWALFGDSQASHLLIAQMASVTGVYGVSFLLVLTNLTIVQCIHPGKVSLFARQCQVYLCSVLIAGALAYGYWKIHAFANAPRETPIRVSLLQGDIDQYKKWDAAYVDEIKTAYEALNRQATAAHADLIVWPETSVPGYLLQDPPLHEWLQAVVRQTGAFHVVGAPVFHGRGAYNSAFLLDPQGNALGEYEKQHLVPFGEIIPFGDFLGRWIHVLSELGGFAAGRQTILLPMRGFQIGINICYEAIFPDLVRRSVAKGADFIVNITNDGWYMRTAAPYQHFAPNVFRAIENGRYLVRADNTGISGIIDPVGHVLSASSIYEPALVTGVIYPMRHRTPYTRVGDLFSWLCAAGSLIAIALQRRPRTHIDAKDGA